MKIPIGAKYLQNSDGTFTLHSISLVENPVDPNCFFETTEFPKQNIDLDLSAIFGGKQPPNPLLEHPDSFDQMLSDIETDWANGTLKDAGK